jgi:hypothetical protein
MDELDKRVNGARRHGAGLLVILTAGALVGACKGGDKAAKPHEGSAVKGSGAELSADEKKSAYEADVAEIRSRVTRLETHLGTFSKPLHDLDALAQSLTTPQAAFEYARDQVALEPYPGVLKGAQGTFVTRGGNALDRALLLAALLKQQNIAVKIAHGKLPPPQVKILLQQMTGGPDAVELILKSLPSEPAAAKLTPAQTEIADLFQKRVKARGKELTADVDQNLQVLETMLKGAGVSVGKDSTADQLALLSDHYWVEATIDDKPVNLDPSFATATFGQKFAPAEGEGLDPEALPDTSFQRVRFRVVAEYLEGDHMTDAELVAQEVKAADLWGKKFRFALAPASESPDVNEFQTSFVLGDDVTAGKPLQLRSQDGEAEPPAGDDLGGGLGGIGGIGESGLKQEAKKPKGKSTGGVLGRVYLEIVSTAPQLAAESYRRVLLDRLQPGQGTLHLDPAFADDRTIRPLLQQVWDGAISVGPAHPLYVFDTQLAAMRTLAPQEEKARGSVYLGETFSDEDVAGAVLSPELVGYFFFSDLTHHQLQRKLAPHARQYTERPRIAFYRHGFAVHDWSDPGGARRYQEGLDVESSPSRVAGPPDETARLALSMGIADTALERSLKANQINFNTVPLFVAAAAQKVPLLTIAPSQKATIDKVVVSPAIKGVLQGELARGRVLIVPAHLVALNKTQTFGWWSIDPRTGNVLGMMELGAGQGMVENVQMQERVARWTEVFAKFYGGVLQCYMGGLASALGELDYYNPLNAQSASAGQGEVIILYHGKPNPNPMPTSKQVAECAIDAACEALADVMNEMAYGGYGADAFAAEAHSLQEIIANWAADQMLEQGSAKGVSSLCSSALKSSFK